MTTALWLLAIQGIIGAFDTLYYHEWRARLAAGGSGTAPELNWSISLQRARSLCGARLAAWRTALEGGESGGTVMIARRKFHRVVFFVAGMYNLGWGAFSVLDPQWLFRFAGMPTQNYPEIFACLGMVVGLYGVLYLEVARVPERGWLLAAVGLLGKTLGPIGWLALVLRGRWPAATAVLCVTNDLIWWIPFGIYLYDAWPARRLP